MGQEFKMCINRETNRKRLFPLRVINGGWFKNTAWTVCQEQPKGPDKSQTAQKPQKADPTVKLPEEELVKTQPEETFVPPTEIVGDILEGKSLVDQYLEVIGKKAHHKKSEDTLRAEINAKLDETK